MFKKKNTDNKSATNIKVYKKTAVSTLASHIWKFIILGVVSLIVLYLVFAATILRFVPAGSDIGLTLVKNNTFKGGDIPAGEVVLINNLEPAGNDLASNLKNSFIPIKSASMVQVLAGPYGSFKYDSSGLVIIDGEPLVSKLKKSETTNYFEKKFLKNEYVALCIKGDCPINELIIFDKNQVIGVTINQDRIDDVINEDFSFFPNYDEAQSGSELVEVFDDNDGNGEEED